MCKFTKGSSSNKTGQKLSNSVKECHGLGAGGGGSIAIRLKQGCHWSGKCQGNSRSGKSQGILEFVREIWNFIESQGNSRKVREI